MLQKSRHFRVYACIKFISSRGTTRVDVRSSVPLRNHKRKKFIKVFTINSVPEYFIHFWRRYTIVMLSYPLLEPGLDQCPSQVYSTKKKRLNMIFPGSCLNCSVSALIWANWALFLGFSIMIKCLILLQ